VFASALVVGTATTRSRSPALTGVVAIPTTVTAPETYTSLERGVIDAIGFPFSYAFGSFRLYEVSRWYTVGMGLGSIHGMTVYSKRSLEALPAEWRQLLIDAKPKAYAAMRQAYEEADEHWVPIYEQGGLERITYTDEERAKFRESAGEPVWQKWVEDMEQRGLPGQEVLDFILEQAEKHAGS
jgi:TRAP-type C4-dicarboxylate transport system substrate-binding protein